MSVLATEGVIRCGLEEVGFFEEALQFEIFLEIRFFGSIIFFGGGNSFVRRRRDIRNTLGWSGALRYNQWNPCIVDGRMPYHKCFELILRH